jgi:hypothetical protein
LVTIGIPAYQNSSERAKALACQSNLTILKASLDAYALDNDVIPGDLSGIDDKYIKKAYAEFMKKPGAWKLKLAYFIIGLEQGDLAYAGVMQDITRQDINLRKCPANLSGGVSYGINSAIKGLSSVDYSNISSGTVLIGDSDSPEFSGTPTTQRHKKIDVFTTTAFAQGVTASGYIYKTDKDITTSGGGGPPSQDIGPR